MKIEIDTSKDSKNDIERVILLLKDIVSKKSSDFDISKNPVTDSGMDEDVSKNDLSKTQKNNNMIMPSKEDLLLYKKGKYSSQNTKDLVISEKPSKEDNNNDDEPKIEVY